MKIKVLTSCAVILVSGITYAGEIFKCTNEKSEVYYNDKPCPVNDIEKKMQAVKDPENPYKYESNSSSDVENKKFTASKSMKQSPDELKKEKLASDSISKNNSQSIHNVNNTVEVISNNQNNSNKKLSYSPNTLSEEQQKSKEISNRSNRDNNTASIGVLEIEANK